ncbi:YihY family inner membrane protein [Poseidonibacter ostreae]|uniref:YihY family inner membrane protein n=1 Tax=Poseidonibacter ostreae TaxID=2654171 RepID=A0A6L4WP53_9BACT|nr:YihY family inner membrane protein [Poseidonibacter ostreae]KAB7885570.1 YihY family inner membrane protein [Poseidonibacter ostreae]
MNENNSEKSLIKKTLNFLDSFFNDDTTYYAASLSFFTIFSILPIIALLIAIVSNFQEFDSYLDIFTSYIFDMINPTHSEDIVNSLKNYISNSNQLGTLGIVYMLFVFIMFVKDYEYIVNKIHKTKRKSIHISFVFYSIFLILIPIIFIALNIMITIYNNNILNIFISYLFSWLIFYLLFKLSVNRKIDNKAALISSLITLISLSLTKNLFIYYVIYNKTYTTIYGSLATLLFTFFWIYISWIIYLYGIKMCHKLNLKVLLNQKVG